MAEATVHSNDPSQGTRGDIVKLNTQHLLHALSVILCKQKGRFYLEDASLFQREGVSSHTATVSFRKIGRRAFFGVDQGS